MTFPYLGEIDLDDGSGYYETDISYKNNELHVGFEYCADDELDEDEYYNPELFLDISKYLEKILFYDEQNRKAMFNDFYQKNEFGVMLFFEHHLEELSSDELKKLFGTDNINQISIQDFLSKMVLESIIFDNECWVEKYYKCFVDFRYTLVDSMTNYGIIISYDNNFNIIEIAMLS